MYSDTEQQLVRSALAQQQRVNVLDHVLRLVQSVPPEDVGDDGRGAPLMHRWTLDSHADGSKLRLHRILRSDRDPAMHDHPWPNRTLVLRGGFFEDTPRGTFWRGPGAVVIRAAGMPHRIRMADGGETPAETWTLFFTGPRCRRDWGFHKADGTWEPWFIHCARRRGLTPLTGLDGLDDADRSIIARAGLWCVEAVQGAPPRDLQRMLPADLFERLFAAWAARRARDPAAAAPAGTEGERQP